METKEKKGYRLAEGKTKIIWGKPGNELEVLIESKDTITAGDGVKHDVLPGKAVAANTTTVNVFRLINQAGIVPTHYLGQEDETSFNAIRAFMLPIEVVVRRIAYGSYLKRNPSELPQHRLPQLVVEFYYKDDAQHDPFMVWQPEQNAFVLHDAKRPVSLESELGRLTYQELSPGSSTLGVTLFRNNEIMLMRVAAASVFELLERTWLKHNFTLVDLKVEFGFDHFGRLMLADVIDNDSWRIWRCGDPNDALDKQVYRELGETNPFAVAAAMKKIAANYQSVAGLTTHFGV